ncbi:LAMI_0B01970g1_1 [Lachancea mirantina]|uniref:LAMI_0B01970g1_1 n=1 Tax=Lachancea mirantina TaxID=1230905 RepID=A0A1G4ITX3_9SACH|nr:LAMI_0B01970g1_1 [Lachancea mirantina]
MFFLLKSGLFNGLTRVGFGLQGTMFPVQVRTLMKTHKGTAKRWRKTSTSFKRGKAGRNHGNAGWSRSSLKSLSGRALAHTTHLKHLKRLLPYN